MKTLIAVVSCTHYVERREAVRETWASIKGPWDLSFFVGAGAPNDEPLESDVIRLGCPDDYASLPAKTFAIIEYAYTHGYERIVKVDDDTFLRLPNALTVLETRACIGHMRINPTHTGGQDYPQGGCYSLSLDAMEVILALPELFEKAGLEDAAVGRAMTYFSIPMTHCELINVDYRQGAPHPENNIIAAHHVTPAVMREIFTPFAKEKICA